MILSKKDKGALQKLQDVFPDNNDAIDFLRHHEFGNRFRKELIKPLHGLSNLLDQPTYFFLDRKTEKKKVVLKENADIFLNCLSKETFVWDRNPEFSSILRPEEKVLSKIMHLQVRGESFDDDIENELQEEAEKEYSQMRNLLNQLSTDLYNSYIELMVLAHKRL